MNLSNINYLNNTNTFLLYRDTKVGHYTMRGCHFHNSYEIYYLTAGERYYFIQDRTYQVKAGDLVFIGPQVIHRTMDTGKPNHTRLLIQFVPQFVGNQQLFKFNSLKKLFDNYCIINLSLREQNIIDNLFRSMIKEVEEKQLDFECQLQSYLQDLLIYSARNFEIIDHSQQPHINRTYAKVSEIVQYMNQHYSENLTLSFIAEQFQMSHFYLSRLFKSSTGFSFIEYLNSIRIKEAQQLLKNTDQKVAIISEAVGFENQSYFGKVFKDMTGISPLQFRKEPPKSLND